MPTTTWRPSARVPGLPAGERHLGREQPDGEVERVKPAGHHKNRAADGRGRTRRHLGLGPDARGARPVHGHRQGPAAHTRGEGCRPLWHLQRSPWRETVYPAVHSFILAHDQAQTCALAGEDVTAEDKVKIEAPKASPSREPVARKKVAIAAARARPRADRDCGPCSGAGRGACPRRCRKRSARVAATPIAPAMQRPSLR